MHGRAEGTAAELLAETSELDEFLKTVPKTVTVTRIQGVWYGTCRADSDCGTGSECMNYIPKKQPGQCFCFDKKGCSIEVDVD